MEVDRRTQAVVFLGQDHADLGVGLQVIGQERVCLAPTPSNSRTSKARPLPFKSGPDRLLPLLAVAVNRPVLHQQDRAIGGQPDTPRVLEGGRHELLAALRETFSESVGRFLPDSREGSVRSRSRMAIPRASASRSAARIPGVSSGSSTSRVTPRDTAAWISSTRRSAPRALLPFRLHHSERNPRLAQLPAEDLLHELPVARPGPTQDHLDRP